MKVQVLEILEKKNRQTGEVSYKVNALGQVRKYGVPKLDSIEFAIPTEYLQEWKAKIGQKVDIEFTLNFSEYGYSTEQVKPK